MKKFDVVALGELLIDFTENGLSNQGNTIFEANPGGAPCNVLSMLTKLGRSCAFVGKVGEDMFGHLLRDTASEVGICMDYLVHDKNARTTLAFVKTFENGDRDFSFYRNPGADMMLREDELPLDVIANSQIFHFGTLSMTHEGVRKATMKAVDCAKQSGAIISFDPNLRPPRNTERRSRMNVRKPVDYSAMFVALDALMVAALPQMELYCEIGRLVSDRTEKGAAVVAAEFLSSTYPDASGFSPRNLRRMREFYRAYEDAPEVLAQAMTIGWTQNVVILEADLTLRERVWYIRAVGQFGWSKLELQRQIDANAHLENALDFRNEVCYTDGNHTDMECKSNALDKEAAGLNYTLMHKDIPVLDMELDESTCSIQKLGTAYHMEHLPLGTFNRNIVDRTELNTWWTDRSIPASRSGVRRALETLDLPNTQLLLTRCFGLSLSDQYWVKPQDSDLQWENINFFCNPFSEDIGDVLLGKAPKTDAFDFSSPDNTSDGYLKKRWKIINGKRCLLKAGSNPFIQQPFNEVIASLIAEHLGIPHVPYSLLWDEGTPYSVCEDFITPDTELVSAWRVMHSMKRDNSASLYRHYLYCCQSLGVQDIQHAVDQMIVLDYLILNEDRHQNNFGLIRNANTLEWVGAAPIFDSGSSLGYDKLPAHILTGRGVECKPFKRTHEEQLKLVSSFDWIDFTWLKESPAEIRTILDQAGEYMDTARRDAILSTYTARLEHLMTIPQVQQQVDDISLDVPQDAAQTYLS